MHTTTFLSVKELKRYFHTFVRHEKFSSGMESFPFLFYALLPKWGLFMML